MRLEEGQPAPDFTLPSRATFVIDAEGTIARAMYGVSPEGHAADVLAALAGLGRAAGARPPRPPA